MKSRLILLSALTFSSVAGAQAGPAAWNGVTVDGYRFVGGELGYVYEVPRTGIGSGTGTAPLTREQAQAGLAAWQTSPITADGYRFVGGELGYVYEVPRTGIGSGTGTAPLTREQVRGDAGQFQMDPLSADGYRYLGGELGYEYEGPAR